MASYIALFNWTDQGIRKVKDTVKRAEDFKASIQNSGGSLKSVYWTMGRYFGRGRSSAATIERSRTEVGRRHIQRRQVDRNCLSRGILALKHTRLHAI